MLVNILSVKHPLSPLFMMSLLLFFVVGIMLGVLPSGYILGGELSTLFYISFPLWFTSIYGGEMLNIRYYSGSWYISLMMRLFDIFVVMLRPVTLTLRVLINVSLGHYLIMMVHSSLSYIIPLVWLIEMFVYMVQSYVFVILSLSYLESMN